jgi:hypothetical protein
MREEEQRAPCPSRRDTNLAIMREDSIDWSVEEPMMYADGRQAAERNEPRNTKGIEDLRAAAAWLAGYDAAWVEAHPEDR